ncbi:MAG: phage tail tape measure protein [Bacteroides sp.]|nr:phage tail tape measure protein [Bacteroides sp.]
MSATQSQNYHVHYTISVEASKGIEQVKGFARAVKELENLKHLNTAVQQTRTMMKELDTIFRPQGKNRKYVYDFTIKTNTTEQRLQRVKTLLTEVQALSKSVGAITVQTGRPLPVKSVKAEVGRFLEMHQPLTKTIGRINSALNHLNNPREIKVKTEPAKRQLQEVLAILQKIHTTRMMISLGGSERLPGAVSNVIPFAPGYPYGVADRIGKGHFSDMNKKSRATMYGQLYRSQTKYAQQFDYERRKDDLLRKRQERESALREKKRKTNEDKNRKEQESKGLRKAERRKRQQVEDEVRNQFGVQRGAINRLQYSKTPTLRALPMRHMFNAYMGFNLIRNELGKAVDYANIMENAHSNLKVTEKDLNHFEGRFDSMARYVRKIGVETKFTAIELAGAVKYLSMAGMDMNTINASIRPITNLALIGDNQVDEIADLSTNIMAGYHIAPTSMNTVADIIASTVSRSNVNILEIAESYTMAAGYMKLSGVEFSESAAAVGILGNMGVKVTMADTALRAMATQFAKPTKEARDAMD